MLDENKLRIRKRSMRYNGYRKDTAANGARRGVANGKNKNSIEKTGTRPVIEPGSTLEDTKLETRETFEGGA